MKKIALIPARYASTRFPYKLMQLIGDKPVIVHTYQNTVSTGLFDEVCVVTDHPSIFDAIREIGGQVTMSKKNHESGSDRIAEFAKLSDAAIILNVQGDEPFVDKNTLSQLLDVFEDDEVMVGSVMKPFKNRSLIADPNYVKVVVDLKGRSLLFSRSPIPYERDTDTGIPVYEHVGIYAFRKDALLKFTEMEMTPLEKAEKIECLRYLENGIPLKMVITDYEGVKIDVPEDLEKAIAFWEKMKD
jgi:3-deoxy-manno-octulosonate cytidylyltransferase (CMP-KDO synthetase)